MGRAGELRTEKGRRKRKEDTEEEGERYAEEGGGNMHSDRQTDRHRQTDTDRQTKRDRERQRKLVDSGICEECQQGSHARMSAKMPSCECRVSCGIASLIVVACQGTVNRSSMGWEPDDEGGHVLSVQRAVLIPAPGHETGAGAKISPSSSKPLCRFSDSVCKTVTRIIRVRV